MKPIKILLAKCKRPCLYFASFRSFRDMLWISPRAAARILIHVNTSEQRKRCFRPLPPQRLEARGRDPPEVKYARSRVHHFQIRQASLLALTFAPSTSTQTPATRHPYFLPWNPSALGPKGIPAPYKQPRSPTRWRDRPNGAGSYANAGLTTTA